MELADDLFVGTKGHVVRVRKRDGEEVWRTRLKGSNLVVVVVEPDGLCACTRGQLWALDAGTGETRWTNNLRGLGYGHGMIASANQAPVATAAVAATEVAMHGAVAASAGAAAAGAS